MYNNNRFLLFKGAVWLLFLILSPIPILVNAVLPNGISLGLFGSLLADAPGTYIVISAPELQEMLQKGKAVVWDIRSQDDYQLDHIPSALNVELSQILKGKWPEISHKKNLLVLCGNSADIPAIQDWSKILARHYGCQIGLLFDGYSGWLNLGFPVEGEIE